jgi:hypothetical protein
MFLAEFTKQAIKYSMMPFNTIAGISRDVSE